MESNKSYVHVDWFDRYMVKYFSLFNLENINSLRPARLKTIQNMLLDHLDKDETPPEDYESFSPARANLLVVILWLLGLKKKASQAAKKAMHTYPANISARSNMAYILWTRNKRYKAYEILFGLDCCKANDSEECSEEFKDRLITAEAQTAYCYTKLGPSYMLQAIKHFNKVIAERPNVDVWKYILALNLRRLEHEKNLTQQSCITVLQAQSQALDLLVKVKDNKENSKELRALAFAELGQILSFPKGENMIVVKNKAKRLGLNARECFKFSLKLNGENTSILRRAGAFYRYSGDLEQSRDLLVEAVRRKPTPTSHHQLGLTFKKMAAKLKGVYVTNRTFHSRWARSSRRQQKKRRKRKRKPMDQIERLMKSPQQERFSRSDPYVTEALEQFLVALKQCSSENSSITYDVGLMYKSLSEYSTALEVFNEIIELEEDDIHCIKAFEQSALVYLEMRSSVSEVELSKQFTEMAHSMLRMAIVCQCRLFETYRKDNFYNKWIWQSFATIGENYKKTRLANVVVHEEWLLKLIKRYDNDLMVLKDIVTYEIFKEDAYNPKQLKDNMKEYITRDLFEDSMVFLCLLKLTDQRRKLSTWKDVDLEFKVFVRGAKGMLLRNETPCDSYAMSLNSLAAKRIFRMAYGNRFDVMSENIISSETPQIIIVYDLSDESAGKCATTVQYLLMEVCGLRTARAPNYNLNTSIQDQGGNQACQLLYIVAKRDFSPEFQRRLTESLAKIQRRSNIKDLNTGPNNCHLVTRTQRHALTLLVGNIQIPHFLQEYPSLIWEPERFQTCSDSQSMSRDAVNAICELFCFLLGITIKPDV